MISTNQKIIAKTLIEESLREYDSAVAYTEELDDSPKINIFSDKWKNAILKRKYCHSVVLANIEFANKVELITDDEFFKYMAQLKKIRNKRR